VKGSLHPAAAVAVGLALTVTPALAASSATFAGKTSDGHQVSFRASKTQINAFTFQSRFSCPKTGTFTARATYNRIKLTKGRFSATFSNPNHSIRSTIKGSIRGRKASGSIRRTARFNAARKLDPNGRLVCTSQTRWSAKKRGR
jgi:hypothetical protein